MTSSSPKGFPTETYLDAGNRTAFVNGGAFIEAHPDFEPKYGLETCLPRVNEGPGVARAKSLLLERLHQDRTEDDDRHLLADGLRIEPINLGGGRFAFTVPAGGIDIQLISRMFVPAHIRPESSDVRTLGLCVKRLQIDGREIGLDHPALEDAGWNEVEGHSGCEHRWTRGETRLPSGTRLLLVELAGSGSYWRETEAPAGPRLAVS
jgi:hypothetical protein